jgi:hypothetical protein
MKNNKILKYHNENKIGISNSSMRFDSESFKLLAVTIRNLFENKSYTPFNDEDKFLLEKLYTGKKGVYKGKEVVLDLPFILRNDKKEFGVYRPSKTKAKDKENGLPKAVIVKFGDPNLRVINEDEDASKNFFNRHKCSLKNDKYTAGWWSCYAPELFGDVLKLKGGKNRW